MRSVGRRLLKTSHCVVFVQRPRRRRRQCAKPARFSYPLISFFFVFGDFAIVVRRGGSGRFRSAVASSSETFVVVRVVIARSGEIGLVGARPRSIGTIIIIAKKKKNLNEMKRKNGRARANYININGPMTLDCLTGIRLCGPG